MKTLLLFLALSVCGFAGMTWEHKIQVSKYFVSVPEGTINCVYFHKVDGIIEKEKDLVKVLQNDGYSVRLATKSEREYFFEAYSQRQLREEAKGFVRSNGLGEKTYPRQVIILSKR